MEGYVSSVLAAQLIYSRVEPAYSPQGKSGFQTVYKSESLSDTEVRFIEERIQCYLPSRPMVRLQFFTVNRSAIVLTHTKQINPHLKIVDRDGRHGAFIAHSLILSRVEFHKVYFNPFAIFDHYSFLDDPEEMIETIGQSSGIAP
jgi:hypothetical protein